jgi:Haem-NO-binding
MKGVVFNLLEHVTTATYGEATWDDILEAADLDGAYTSLGSYPDRHLAMLIDAVGDRTGRAPEEVVRWFGRSAIARLAGAYPAFFEPHRTTQDFLLTLNEIIHPEVRKLYPGADVPDFGMVRTADGLTMVYESPRRMCSFATGLIEGAADYYGEQVSIVEPRCMKRGNDQCELQIRLA